jgi:hypothetical protein
VPEHVRTVLDTVAAALDGSATEIRIILGEPGPAHRRGAPSADGPRPAISWSPELPLPGDSLAPEPLVAILPIRRGGRTLATIEMVASPLLLRDRWLLLEAIAAQAALVLESPEEVEAPPPDAGHWSALGLARHVEAMVGARFPTAGDPGSAVRGDRDRSDLPRRPGSCSPGRTAPPSWTSWGSAHAAGPRPGARSGPRERSRRTRIS